MPENKVYEFFFRRMDGMIPLRKGLDAYAMRQKAIASNIANSETPGYVAKKVSFEEELSKVLNKQSGGLIRTSGDHIPVRGGLRAMDKVKALVEDAGVPENYNGVNNVDIEKEMADLATNQIDFTAATKIMGIRFRMLKSAILGHS
jgi:flagellar basal-body rod protein FlgB